MSIPSVSLSSDHGWLVDASGAGRIGLWQLDLSTGWIECTERCRENLGFPPDANIRLDDVYRVMHADDRAASALVVQKAIESRDEYHLCYRVVWPDGSTHWIDSRGRVGEGVITGTTADITEQHLIEERLVRESNLIRMITTHVAEALWFMDAEGHLTFMNPAAQELFGWSEDEIRGRVLHEVIHYRKPDGTPYPIEECPVILTLRSAVPVRNWEDLWVHKSGRFIPVICSATPIVERGEVKGAVVSTSDNSERNAVEDALRETSRAKDEFLATISHELRTPMTAILGWLGYLRMCDVPATLTTALEQIEASAKAQAALVDDLVDSSRIVTGKLHLHLQETDIAEVLEDAVTTIRPTAKAKQIMLTATAGCNGARVRADSSRMRQVLWNLLSNAIKFTPERGAVVIDTRLRGDDVIVTVRDTGIGIAPEFLPRVFDRFAQESGTVRYQPGLGLGLAIVKQLVEMHGGRVGAESAGTGCGATFTVMLPRAGAGS